MKKNIAIIFGGVSSEHEVSINSARNIFNALDKNKYSAVLVGISKQGSWYNIPDIQLNDLVAINDKTMDQSLTVTLLRSQEKSYCYNLHSKNQTLIDCAFPIVHGTNGEDGALQGYLKMLEIPFVGCGVLSSAIGMDKEVMKIIMTNAGIPNSKYMVIKRDTPVFFEDLHSHLGLPFFIKPANAGSSVGVHKIKNADDFKVKLADAFKYDHKIIAEEFIQGREIEISVMGLNQTPEAAIAGELIVNHEFYSYEAKYLDDNGAQIVIPAQVTDEQMNNIKSLALKTYQSLYCDGLTRVDFFMKNDGSLIVNEINTLPGFTKISMYPKMWQAKGLEYPELITRLIQFAFDKEAYNKKLNLDFRA